MTAPVQLFDTLDATSARDLTDQIKVGVEAVWHLIARAYQGQAWRSLGYSSWDDYCTREFGTARLRLPREDRQEIVASLRESGLSTRAIASATGQSDMQVRRDLSGATNVAGGPVTGIDGKHYQPTRPEPVDDPEPLFAPGERDAILETLHEEYGDELTAEQIEQAADENVESKHVPQPSPQLRAVPEPRPEWKPAKPDLGGGVSHPARYSPELIDLFRYMLRAYTHANARLLDPFAGPGGIHQLHPAYDTTGVELEPEWANLHPRTLVGSALALPFPSAIFDVVVTSPTYGNRLADHHDAADPERRRSYTHDLGRPLHDDNSGDLHWRTTAPGTAAMGSYDYRNFHTLAWTEAVRTLAPGGLFVLNCCDHIREGLVQPVTAWHCHVLGRLGLEWVESRSVPTHKLRQGANANLREQEQVHVFRKPL